MAPKPGEHPVSISKRTTEPSSAKLTEVATAEIQPLANQVRGRTWLVKPKSNKHYMMEAQMEDRYLKQNTLTRVQLTTQ